MVNCTATPPVPARSALTSLADGLSVDASGNLLFGDTNNRRARQITLATGIIDTLAGSGGSGNTGDGLPALSTHLIVTAPNFTTQNMPIDIDQSYWSFLGPNNLVAQTVGVPFNVTVRAND